ncbi:pentapeptide repeat-containing protein [Dapis sp. BLCC M229]|uniref:pentapeptide repeat-containing protein n=2 Tax=Microcoleaceae TaxID=1892252 RepID=UPI003CF6BB59
MNRRKRKILQLYQQGERNFKGANLRGLSFKGKDLSDADFSEADIRGTNFSGANLTGAKFCGAKAGLQKRWVVVLLVCLFIVAGVLGFFNFFISGSLILELGEVLISEPYLANQIATWAGIILVVCGFWMIIIFQGVRTEVLALALFLVITLTALSINFTASWGSVLILTLVLTLAGALTLAGTLALVGVLALTLAGAMTGNLAGFINRAFPDRLDSAFNETLPLVFILVLIFVLVAAQTSLSAYIAHQSIKGDKKYTLIRNIAIAFAAIGGTSFRDANLTDADFTNATLKSTDFREANITHACWKNTIKLDRIRPGKTYLKDAKVRELVKTGKGENINLDRLSYLQGINLQGTNLTNASFIEANLNLANLQDANLSRAKLVGTFLDQADLTGATLTGAFLEDWGITTTTKLDGIKCDYVYMRLPPDKRPDFLKLPAKDSLNDNPRREPANWNRNFQEGEFVDFITPMMETLNFYHAEKVDPRIVAYSFQQLQEEHPEADLEIISMEKRGKNRQGLLVKADTAPEAEHSELHAEYFDTYDRLKALPPSELELVLAEKDRQIRRLEGWVDSVIQSPNIYAENYHNQGDTKMAESSGDQIHAREIHGAVGNKGEIYGIAGSGGEIKDSAKIARTIHESQEQNLAQAAKDIQELLEQLDETYPSDTTAGKMKIATEVITQIDNNSTKAERIFSAIKAGGVSAVEQLLNHPASSFVIAALEDWQKTK